MILDGSTKNSSVVSIQMHAFIQFREQNTEINKLTTRFVRCYLLAERKKYYGIQLKDNNIKFLRSSFRIREMSANHQCSMLG